MHLALRFQLREENSMERVLTCIVCPRGCTITVKGELSDLQISGNFCPRGAKYAKNEVTSPRRVVTSSVRYKDKMVSVKTDKDIRKDLIFDIMKVIHQTVLLTRVEAGAIIIKNVDGEGANVIATSTVFED